MAAQTILITGATDGIGLATSKRLVSLGHNVLVHGRNRKKLEKVEKILAAQSRGGQIVSYMADLSHMTEAHGLVRAVAADHAHLDVLINNAGVYVVSDSVTSEGLDTRFAVNTIAPFLLTKGLLPLFGTTGRVVNLSSAAQAPLDPEELMGPSSLSDGLVYAQSKLALTMWSRHLARALKDEGPAVIAVNPKSFLGSKMVKEAYGVAGSDIGIGADILVRAALSEEFATASGRYFDNDTDQFALPHPDALDVEKCREIVRVIEAVLEEKIL